MNVYVQPRLTLREQKLRLMRLMVSTSFRVTLIISIIVFGILYVLQTNAVSTKGYALSDLERQISELNHETQGLAVQVAEQQSMRSLENRLKDTDLVAVDQVEYASAINMAVARR